MEMTTFLILLGAILQGAAGYDQMNPYSRWYRGGIPGQTLQRLLPVGTGTARGPLTAVLGSLPGKTVSLLGQPPVLVQGSSPSGTGVVQRPLRARVSGSLPGKTVAVPNQPTVPVQGSSPGATAATRGPLPARASGSILVPSQPKILAQLSSPRRRATIRGPSPARVSGSPPGKTRGPRGQSAVQARSSSQNSSSVIPVQSAVGTPRMFPVFVPQATVPIQGSPPIRPGYVQRLVAPFPQPLGLLEPQSVSPAVWPVRQALQGQGEFLPIRIPLPPGAAKPFTPKFPPPLVVKSLPLGNPYSQISAQERGMPMLPNSNLGPPPPRNFGLPQPLIRSLLLALIFDNLPDHQKKMGITPYVQPTVAQRVQKAQTVDSARDLDCVTMSELLNLNYHPFGCDDDLCPRGKKCRTVQGVGMCCPPTVTTQMILSNVPM